MTRVTSHADDDGQAASALDWEAQLAHHEGWLRAVIARQGVEPDAVQDVFQEVARAAVEQRSPLSDAACVRGWLYRLACIRAARYRRGKARQRRHETAFVQASIHASPAAGEEQEIPIVWLLSKERREQVHAALARLADEEANLLRWKYFENQSYRELSQRLNISEKAVDSRLHRARQRLRAELAQLDDEE